VQSKAPTVDEYMAELPPDRRERLEQVRALCLEHLPDHEEAMEYGMPVYRRDGKVEFAFASQVRHIALYVTKEGVVAENADRLAGLDMGKGCLSLKPSASIDGELVEALLVSTARSPEAPC
jgi:uncharacterized protein YdhG (YjbR/CyaY superfamily)